jgi:glucose uptake protein GlcU
MNNTKVKPPKWTMLCILVGATCAFIAAGFAFSKNGKARLIFGVMALALYIVGFVGVSLHKKSNKNL